MFLHQAYDQAHLSALYNMADICIVSPLHDGMNLVAKEYVASRRDETGVLVLSEFAGAADELAEALVINPFDTVNFVAAIETALEMCPEEQVLRMRHMRDRVAEHDVYRWASRMISEMAGLDPRGASRGRVPRGTPGSGAPLHTS